MGDHLSATTRSWFLSRSRIVEESIEAELSDFDVGCWWSGKSESDGSNPNSLDAGCWRLDAVEVGLFDEGDAREESQRGRVGSSSRRRVPGWRGEFERQSEESLRDLAISVGVPRRIACRVLPCGSMEVSRDAAHTGDDETLRQTRPSTLPGIPNFTNRALHYYSPNITF